MIKVTCETRDVVFLEDLKEFQGGLKERTSEDIEKIKKSIKRFGFATPFFVWKDGEINRVLDGHGRLKALQSLEKEGEKIPPLPVVYIECENEEEAKNLLLRIVSSYGAMTREGVLDFMGDFSLDIADVSLPFGVIDFDLSLDLDFGGLSDDVKEPTLDVFQYTLLLKEAYKEKIKKFEKKDIVKVITDYLDKEEVAHA